MLKSEWLQAFSDVLAQGGISAAAEKRNLTPMAISKQIANLEASLGEALFERTQKRLKLTEFGKAFQTQAEQVLAQHHAMDAWLASRDGDVEGCIKVVAHAPEVYKETLFPWLPEFLEQYPKLEIELDIVEGRIRLEEHQYDIYWAITDYLGEFYPGLKRRQLWQASCGIYASPAYLEKHGPIDTLDDLDRQQVIGYLHNQPADLLLTSASEDEQTADQPFGYKQLPSRVRTASGLIQLAIQGLGLINAMEDAEEIEEAVNAGKLAPVLEDHWWQDAKVHLYYHDTKQLQPKVRAFIDFFMGKVAEWGSKPSP